MPLPIPVTIGNRNLKLKLGNEAVADALLELQARIPSGMLGGLKLSLDQALPLLERGDPHALVSFLKHGAKFEKNLTDSMLFSSLDEYTDPDGKDGSLSDLAEPIKKALSASGLIVRKKTTTDADGKTTEEIERPHLVAVPGE